jgi:hypothetical protein
MFEASLEMLSQKKEKKRNYTGAIWLNQGPNIRHYDIGLRCPWSLPGVLSGQGESFSLSGPRV